MIYALCILLIFVGVYGLLTKRNVVKMVIGLSIIEYGVNLLLILFGYRTSPIMKPLSPVIEKDMYFNKVDFITAGMVDPLPQALVLISIVIELGTLALLVALCIRLYERYGTFDLREIRRLRG